MGKVTAKTVQETLYFIMILVASLYWVW